MKKLIAFVVMCVLGASSAQASIVNYDGQNIAMGILYAGQSGSITHNFSSTNIPHSGGLHFVSSLDGGRLSGMTSISFTYTLPLLTTGTSRAAGLYSYSDGVDTLSGFSNANSNGVSNVVGLINGSPALALVLATANLGNNTARTTITNYGTGNAVFESIFTGFLRGAPGVTYAVSAVPLPAALPMFAALMAGMYGFAARRRRALKAL